LINALATEELRNNLIPLLGAFIETPRIISENYFVVIKTDVIRPEVSIQPPSQYTLGS
jgi:hypothetical protein